MADEEFATDSLSTLHNFTIHQSARLKKPAITAGSCFLESLSGTCWTLPLGPHLVRQKSAPCQLHVFLLEREGEIQMFNQ